MKRFTFLTLLLAFCFLGISAIAGETGTAAEPAQGMPEMGAPKEMANISFLVGSWDYVMKFTMSPGDTNWMTTKGVATYSLTLDNCVLMGTHEGESFMPGMPPFRGMGMEVYDRELKQWTISWVDNIAARISVYTGTHANGSSSYSGEDIMMGTKCLTKMMTSNETANSFDWKMDQSFDGGKTWATTMTAVYTKRK